MSFGYLMCLNSATFNESHMTHISLSQKIIKLRVREYLLIAWGLSSDRQSWYYMTSRSTIPVVLLFLSRDREGRKMVVRWTSCNILLPLLILIQFTVECNLLFNRMWNGLDLPN